MSRLTFPKRAITSVISETAVITTTSGAKTISGVFYDKYETAKLMEMDYEASSISFLVSTEDASDAKQNDPIVIDGTTYYVSSPEVMDDNSTLLILKLEQTRT